MSKYIRTKDGRLLECEKLNNITKLSIDTCEEIIEQADSIEGLCDEFVIFKQGEKYICWFDKQCDDFNVEHDGDGKYFKRENCDKVYGAIWTDKGLLYVAKMNDKGELELL